AEQMSRLAVLQDDAADALDPAVLAFGAGGETVLHMIGLAAAQAFLDGGLDLGLIVGMNVLLERRERAVEAARRHVVHRFEIARPLDGVGADVPRPDPDLSGLKR